MQQEMVMSIIAILLNNMDKPLYGLLTQIKHGGVAVSNFIGTLHMNWWIQTNLNIVFLKL